MQNEAYAKLVLLRVILDELRSELTIDACKDTPRLVLMSFTDLDARLEEIESLVLQEAKNEKQ